MALNDMIANFGYQATTAPLKGYVAGVDFSNKQKANEQVLSLGEMRNQSSQIKLNELKRTTQPDYLAAQAESKAKKEKGVLNLQSAQTEKINAELGKIKTQVEADQAKQYTDEAYNVLSSAADPNQAAKAGLTPGAFMRSQLEAHKQDLLDKGNDSQDKALNTILSLPDGQLYKHGTAMLSVLPEMRSKLDKLELQKTPTKIGGSLTILDEKGNPVGGGVRINGEAMVDDPSVPGGLRPLKPGESAQETKLTGDISLMQKPFVKASAKITEDMAKQVNAEYINSEKFAPVIDRLATTVLSPDFKSGKFQALIQKPFQEWASSTLGSPIEGVGRNLNMVDGLLKLLALRYSTYQPGSSSDKDAAMLIATIGGISDPTVRLQSTVQALREDSFRTKEKKFQMDNWLKSHKGDLNGFAKEWDNYNKENPRIHVLKVKQPDGGTETKLNYFTDYEEKAAQQYGRGTPDYDAAMKLWKDEKFWRNQ